MVERITLHERMRRVLRIRNDSPRTEQAYIRAVPMFAAHFGQPPDQLGAPEILAHAPTHLGQGSQGPLRPTLAHRPRTAARLVAVHQSSRSALHQSEGSLACVEPHHRPARRPLCVDDLADTEEIAIWVDDGELSKAPRLVFQCVHSRDTGTR